MCHSAPFWRRCQRSNLILLLMSTVGRRPLRIPRAQEVDADMCDRASMLRRCVLMVCPALLRSHDLHYERRREQCCGAEIDVIVVCRRCAACHSPRPVPPLKVCTRCTAFMCFIYHPSRVLRACSNACLTDASCDLMRRRRCFFGALSAGRTHLPAVCKRIHLNSSI